MGTPITTKEKNEFKSFAVLDFEMADYPWHKCNKVGIIEVSIYGIAISEFNNALNNALKPPKLPRVLHKTTLMVNPMMAITPSATRASKLDNFMLENESKFDANAGEILLSFLKHLQQPVCLVAHKGDRYDFPILKKALERNKLIIPSDIYALDSLLAFSKIDKMRKLKSVTKTMENTNEDKNSLVIEIRGENFDASSPTQKQPRKNTEKDESKLEIQAFEDVNKEQSSPIVIKGENEKFESFNETTPKRPIKITEDAAAKRTGLEGNENFKSVANNTTKKSHVQRDLFKESPHNSTNATCSEPGKVSFKGYKLSVMFEKAFSIKPTIKHQAEADVDMLTKLMLHYGLDFVHYAEKHSKPFSEIPDLGQINNL